MPSSLFPPSGDGNTVLQAVNALRSAAHGNPQALYQHLYQTNPQFRTFADSVSGKTPEQAFEENGIDFAQIKRFL